MERNILNTIWNLVFKESLPTASLEKNSYACVLVGWLTGWLAGWMDRN